MTVATMAAIIGPVVGSTPMTIIPVVITVVGTPMVMVAGICQAVGQQPHGGGPHHRRSRIDNLLRITIGIVSRRAAHSYAAKQASQDKSAKSRVHVSSDVTNLGSIQKILT